MEKAYQVTGMKCDGCVKTVTEKLSAVRGVEKVLVDLNKQEALITGNPFPFALSRALKEPNLRSEKNKKVILS